MLEALQEPTAMPSLDEPAGEPALAAPSFDGQAQTDVAVIGGGFTGLSAALHLAEGGKAVVLLEAKEIGWGASSRCFGQVVPYAKLDHEALQARFPGTIGQRLIDELASGPEVVQALINKYDIACHVQPTGMIVAAHKPQTEAGLDKVIQYWQGREAPVAWLEGQDLADALGTDFYRRALIDRRAFSIDPPALVRGLGRAARQTGVQIFENSLVTAISEEKHGWSIDTAKGNLKAGAVVFAGNAYGGALRPELPQAMIPARMYQLMSAPLSDAMQARVLPARIPMIDTTHLFSGLRIRSDGRLHASSDGPVFSFAGQPNTKKTESHIRRLFPDLKDLVWAERWAGVISIVPDLLPRLHQLAPGLWTAYGFSGRGIAFGTLLGREMARCILGGRNTEPFLPLSDPQVLRSPILAEFALRFLMQWYRWRDAWDRQRLAG